VAEALAALFPRHGNAATAAALIPPRNEVEKIIGPRVTP